ncbi:MAG: DNA recombination protein RmuC [Vicingaceae bacterium]
MDLSFLMPVISILLLIGIVALFLQLRKQSNGISDQEWQEIKDDNTRLKVEKNSLEERIKDSIQKFREQEEKQQALQNENKNLHAELEVAKADYKNLEERLNEEKAELEKLNQKFTKEFKLVANQLLKDNSDELSEKHHKELDQLLTPLKENLKSFEDKIQERYVSNRDEQLSLKQEIKNLTKLNNVLNEQAQNLTNALKGDSKKQGNWGELVLEKILESSGLIKGKEYETEVSDTNSNNQRIRPDVVVKLPDERHIIVDSKVSLSAYEKYVSSEDELEKQAQLKLHLSSVRNHVKLLSEKNYQSGLGVNTPDFVLLFIPIESSFSLAVQNDPDLYVYAWDRKVVIVSPTTLLATLRTIASVWKHERQAQNAKEIADRAGALYDKFYNFVEDLQKIGQRLQQAQDSYHGAFNKLSTGNGNLLRQAEMLKELGANTQKSLPKEIDQS